MKRTMTAEEFAKTFFEMFERRMDDNHGASACDNILRMIFWSHEKDVFDHMVGSFPDHTYDGKSIDWVGPMFHKGFRSWDPIDATGGINSIAWQALTDAPIFWKVLNQVCRMNDGETEDRICLDQGE
jgi:hypothetical protein